MPTEVGPNRWASRPWAARLTKAATVVVPIVVSVLISVAISRRIDAPTTWPARIGWWIVLSAIATVVLIVAERISRRLLPLSALFGLSLIFPDEAPSRFRTALRTGTVAQLRRKIDDAKLNGLGDDPIEAANKLVELAGALSVHDRLTRGHSERVRAYTKLIAEELGLPADEVDRLQWAGLAHDVGKLFVASEILNKPGRLTDEEYETIKAHTVAGAELVAPLRGWLGDALDAVDQHHERWDGKGYPRGLAGTDIALAGRVVAVADVFDVITSVRSYKSAEGVAEAREELIRCSGTQFDPRVVRAFLNIGLGRLRLLVGPLSWLAQLPVVGRAPVGAAAAPAVAALGTTFSLLFGGFFGGDVPLPERAEAVLALAAPEADVAAAPTTSTSTSTSTPTTTSTSTSTTVTTSTSTSTSTTVTIETTPATTTTTVPPTTAAPTTTTTTAPVAVATVRDDRASAIEDGSVEIDVLANDEGPDGTELRIVATTVAPRGTVTTDGSTITFTPEPDQHGTATITYTVVDIDGITHTGTVVVEIAEVNDAPVATDDTARTDEDTVVTVAVLSNDFDVDDDDLTITAVGGATLGTATVVDDRIRYVPASDANGTDTMTYTVSDGNGGSATATLTIVVTAVNDAPTISLGADPIVDEDAGAQTLSGWATGITPGGGSDEAGQSLWASVTSTNAGLFASLPALDPSSGTLSFTPAADANGSSTVTVTLDDGVDTTTVAFVIRVNAIDDAPVLVAGSDAVVAEDSGLQVVSGWATAVGPGGGPDEAGQTLTAVTASATSGLLTAVAFDPTTNTLRYTPAADANGSTLVTIDLDDGTNTTTATFNITITPVDDAPTITVGADPTATEDDPAQTLTAWATGITPGGGSDEAGQTLTATLAATTPALFSTQPALDPTTGTLTYTPAPDANGSTIVTIDLDDGTNTATATFNITITPVNDAPTITVGADPSTPEDDGPETLRGWATDITPGSDPGEAGQTLTATVTATEPALFSIQPALDPTTGTLTYTPAPDANGSTLVTIDLDDGTDITTVTFNITIIPVNDAPAAGNDTATLTEDDPATVITVLGNDTDIDGDALTVTAVTGATLGTATTDGTTVTYTPTADANGTDTLTTTIDDGNGGTDTATLTITITPVNDAPTAGDDNYAMTADAPLTFAAPGLLDNDSDVELDPLTVNTTPLSAPAQGSVTLAADGSFTYTAPSSSFGGEVQFTYEVSDDQGGSDTATATIQVSPVSGPGTYFLGSSSSSSTSPLNTTPAAPATPEPDYPGDFDASPGFTIKASTGSLGVTDVTKFQHWTLAPTVPLSLRGPTRLHLWSTTSGFDEDDAGHYHVWLHDCAADGTNCDAIAGPTSAHVDEWNRETSGWVLRTIDIGSVDRTIMPGRMLRMRLMFEHNDMWIALSGTRSSSLEVTLGNSTPVAITDTVSVLEESGTTNIAVLANDRDADLVPSSVTITAPPATGSAVALGDGTIDYTPAPDQAGPDAFVYRVCDSVGQCGTSTVDLTVVGVNDQPSFQPGGPASADEDDGTTTIDDWATSIDAGPADEDIAQTVWFEVTNDNAALFVDQPAIDPSGKLTFKGADDAFGSANVTVTLRDSGGTANGGFDASAPAVFTVTINPVPDDPTAVDDVGITDEMTGIDIDVLANDVDPDPEPLAVSTFTQPADGTVTLNGDGTLRYAPDPGFYGDDQFDYTVDDGTGRTDNGRVRITVNQTPVALNDTYLFAIGTRTLAVTANDDDDDPLAIFDVDTTSTSGSVACGATSCTFTPGGIGIDSFRYRLRDPRGMLSGWATVTVTVTL